MRRTDGNDAVVKLGEEDAVVKLRRVDGETDRFDEVWVAFVELFGDPTSPTRTLRAKMVRELSERGATGSDVIDRASRLVKLWGPRYVTPASLWKHWNRFDGKLAEIDGSAVSNHVSEERYRRLAEGGEVGP